MRTVLLLYLFLGESSGGNQGIERETKNGFSSVDIDRKHTKLLLHKHCNSSVELVEEGTTNAQCDEVPQTEMTTEKQEKCIT